MWELGVVEIYSFISTMSVIEIVSLACLFILLLIIFSSLRTNHLVLMQFGQQRAEQDGAMHVILHQRRVLETEGNYIGTAIGIQRMAVQPSTIFHQRIANRPLPRENDE